MEVLGIELDAGKNSRNAQCVSSGRTKVLVIPTNEELTIARDTRDILKTAGRKSRKAKGAADPEKEIRSLSRKQKAEIVLIWSKNPGISFRELSIELNKKIGRIVSAKALEAYLKKLNLT
jgi:hypothetical protein